jgi:hypothetical protein
MMTRWLFLAIIQVILMIIHAVFSMIICLFIHHGMLPWWLRVFQTPDALAIGDQSFHENEMAWTKGLPLWLQNYICGMAGAIRNPAYGFADMAGVVFDKPSCFTTTAQPGKPDIDVGDHSTFGEVYRTVFNGDGKEYFEFRLAGKWSASLAWYIQLGWSLPADGQFDQSRRHLCVYVRPFIKIS